MPHRCPGAVQSVHPPSSNASHSLVMTSAARTRHKPDIAPVVCGPSNIGNYFAAHGIDATCGFGVTYENLHAPNEHIKLGTIQMTSDVYATAIHSLRAS
jgi:succinyl-diaminopimelate desuccinylase